MNGFLKVGAVGAAAAAATTAAVITAINLKKPAVLPDGFTVTAHTGCEKTKANSIECLKKSVELGVAVAEVDVTERPDGTPVLLHRQSAAADEGVVFDEAIRFVSENSNSMCLNLDLKAFNHIPNVVEVLEKYNMKDRCLFTGVKAEHTQQVKLDGGSIPYFLNATLPPQKIRDEDAIKSVMYEVQRSCAVGINCNFIFASQKMTEMFHSQGLKVSYWTADTKTVMKYLLSLGPDNITTRYPTVLNTLV